MNLMNINNRKIKISVHPEFWPKPVVHGAEREQGQA
jgi:hypothetical protein